MAGNSGVMIILFFMIVKKNDIKVLLYFNEFDYTHRILYAFYIALY